MTAVPGKGKYLPPQSGVEILKYDIKLGSVKLPHLNHPILPNDFFFGGL